jgi:hypothetical protein
MLRRIALMWRVLDGIREGMHEYTKAPIGGRTLHP